MKTKYKFILINTIGIFLLNFLSHFLYNLCPNFITSLFFPVNESIFEHLKMLYTTIIIWGLVEYIIYKKNNISTNNFLFTLFISAILNIIILLIIYLPVYYLIGENLIITIIILLISIFLTQLFTYNIKEKKKVKLLNFLSLILIPIIFFVFAYLTYNPIENDFFLDKEQNKYGISTLND